MTDEGLGSRDRRGNWTPNAPIRYPPVFVWPPEPFAFARWLVGWSGYLLPWNLLYAAVATAVWVYATPPLDEMRSFEAGWIALIGARNAAIVLAFYGAFHLVLYVRRAQGTEFKYNPNWPSTGNPAFLFGRQTADNMIWTLASGVPIWTAYEVLTLWAFANGVVPIVSFAENPVYFVGLMLVVPIVRDVHFYCIHRLIHWPPLYRTVHKLHHANVNPGPWSGLSMHPVEHLLYFSGILIHWVVPSHPVHALFHVFHAGLAPVPGHTGFDRLVVGKAGAVDTHCFAHYLHHKYFEVNYADGVVPLDRWFGTFHDGTKAAEEAMNERLMVRASRATASRRDRT